MEKEELILLINKLQKNNKSAFDALFHYYYPRLMSYTASIVDRIVAEDIVQDVFVYIWENRTRLVITDGFSSYIFHAAYTRCLDYLRKSLTKERYQSMVYDGYLEELSMLFKHEDSIINELSRNEFYKQLYEFLDQLPEQRKEVFIKAYINGMKAKEIAEEMNIPQRTIESHLYLAMKYMKERFKGKDFYLFLYFLSII